MSPSVDFFSLVVPTFNESDGIIQMVQQAHLILGELPHEIIVVDDDSPDLTWKITSDYATSNPFLKVIRRTGLRGLSSAVMDGFAQARGNILGVMDADMSHDEKVLPLLIGKIQAGADLAIGSRRIPGGGADKWPWYRRFMSDFSTGLAKAILNIKISDPMSGFFVLRRSLYERVREELRPQGYKILLEIYSRAKTCRFEEVPYIFKDRKQGYSKLGLTVIRQFLGMVFLLKMDRFIQKLRRR